MTVLCTDKNIASELISRAVSHELVSGSRMSGGRKPRTNHQEIIKRRKFVKTWEFSVRSHPGETSPKLNSSGMPAQWSAMEDYYG
jgi:hypothetical protein